MPQVAPSPHPSFYSQRVDDFNFAPKMTHQSSIFDRVISAPGRLLEPLLSYLFSQHPPLNVQVHGPSTLLLAPRVTAFGDVHGEFFGLIENLYHANLVNNAGQWIGENEVFVQLGDVIDRGILSEQCWNYLGILQKQAEEKGGQVIRIIGNHELSVLQGYTRMASLFIRDIFAFKERMKSDILDHKVQLAYTDGKRLFVHAGLRSKLRESLLQEISTKKQVPIEDLYLEDLVDYLNELLIQAIETDDFSHAIFQVGYLRGGDHSQGGVLWADMQEILQSKHARDLPQVVGHNPPRRADDPPIRITDSHHFILADAGMNAIYGGKRAYVVFEDPDIKIRFKDEESQWIEKIALDILRLSSHQEINNEPSHAELYSDSLDEESLEK